MSEAMIRTPACCYLSTPEHARSLMGRFVYIYTDKGELQLTVDRLLFRKANGLSLTIALDAITEITMGHYSRWHKPFRLDYIGVTYEGDEGQRSVLLTPARSWATPTWETNKVVAEWERTLRAAHLARRTKRCT